MRWGRRGFGTKASARLEVLKRPCAILAPLLRLGDNLGLAGTLGRLLDLSPRLFQLLPNCDIARGRLVKRGGFARHIGHSSERRPGDLGPFASPLEKQDAHPDFRPSLLALTGPAAGEKSWWPGVRAGSSRDMVKYVLPQ